MSKDIDSIIASAVQDESLIKFRFELAHFAAETFLNSGKELQVFGHIFGTDRKTGASTHGHGDDETVAVSILLKTAAQLISASADLFKDGRSYAAAALLRQIVEIEYLAWAIETNDKDGEKWLRSDRKEREEFFKPSKLRKASNGKFRSQDYGYHCEFGGHPVPGVDGLLDNRLDMQQVLLSDLLGHAGRIWNHFASWAKNKPQGKYLYLRNQQMSEKYSVWKSLDPLFELPPPP